MLPFVVQPRIKTVRVPAEDLGVGQFDFPQWGYLLAGEQALIDELGLNQATTDQLDRITTVLEADGVPRGEAALQAAAVSLPLLGIPHQLSTEDQAVADRHADLLAEVKVELERIGVLRTRRTVTAAIVCRQPGCRGWTDEESDRLPQPLFQAIYGFMLSEQAGANPEAPQDTFKKLADTLGKLRAAVAAETPTGPPFTGAVVISGQADPSSAASGSGSSPAPTSKPRSRKAKGD